jgi:hypothetical protein
MPCTFCNHDINIDSHTIIQCGGIRPSFANEEYTPQDDFPCHQLRNPKTIEVIDSYLISSSNITEYIPSDCTIGNHHELLVAYIMSIGYYPIVPGIPWLKKYNANTNFVKMDIPCPSPNYLPH